MVTFIKILDDRIKLSSIKRYRPYGDSKLTLRFNNSGTNIVSTTYNFKNKKERDKLLDKLDNICLK